MSFKKTLIFFIILLLLGGYYYIVEVRMAEQKQAMEEAEKKLFQVEADQIQELIVKRTDQEIVLKKQDNVWKMVQPVAASADEQNVDSMITGFVEAKRDEIITENPSDDQEFGLDTPEIVITAKTQEVETDFQLSIGQKIPTASEYYARVGDTPTVISVGPGLKTSLDKTTYDLRDKTILDFEPAQVKQTVFTIKDPNTSLAQEIRLEQTDSQWKIVSPKVFKADTAKIGTLLSTVKSSRIKEFIEEKPEDLEQYGLDQPGTRLSLVVGEDSTQKTLLLGKSNEANDGIYAKHEGAEKVFVVPTTLIEQFPKHLNDLRDKTLLTFNNEDIQKIELVSTDEPVVLERASLDLAGEDTTDEAWKITQPAEFNADNSNVQDLLSNAKDVTVEQFVTEEPVDLTLYGLAPPQMSLTLWEKDRENPQQLLLGNPDVEKTGIYAKLGEQGSVVLVKPDALEQLKKTAFDLRYKKILAFTSDQVEKIQIKYADTTLLMEKDGDIWKAKEPEKQELLTYKVNNLLYDLADLEFQEEILTPDEDVRTYGLSEPEVELTLWGQDEKVILTLLIGKQLNDTNILYAKTSTEKPVYVIDPAFLDEIPKELQDLAE